MERVLSTKMQIAQDPKTEIWPVFSVICIVGTFALVVGYTYPALSLAMEAAGHSKTMIGLQTAMSGFGVVVSSILTPLAALRYDPWRLGVITGILTIFILLGFGVTEPGWSWFALRFALGMSISTLFILSETWLNEFAPEHLRGRLIAVYTSTIAALFGVGPLLIPFIGYEGSTPFFVVGCLVSLLLLPLWTIRSRIPVAHNADRRELLAVFAIIPVLILSVAAFGMFDGAIMGLWAVYSIDLGYTETIASWTLSASILGNLFLQVPIGWLADRMSRQVLLSFCAGSAALGALFLPFLDLNAFYIWPFLMIWGGLCFGIYTISLTLVGEHLKGAKLISANAVFGLMWGIGSIVGGSVTGGLMDIVGPYALPGFVALIFGALLVVSLLVAPVRSAATR